MIRKLNPYEAFQSLYDMYVQAVTRPATKTGGDLARRCFENGTRDSQLIRWIFVGPDYVVGPGDGLSVDFWVRVATPCTACGREGRVSLPEVGQSWLAEKSLPAVQQICPADIEDSIPQCFGGCVGWLVCGRSGSMKWATYESRRLRHQFTFHATERSVLRGGPTERGSMRF